MKTFYNLKNKANALSKEKLEAVRNGKQTEGNTGRTVGEIDQRVHVTGEASHEASATSSLASSPTKASIKGAHAGKAERDPVVESLVQSERREVVKEEFFKESPESYTTTRYLNIKAATYNVNGRRPPDTLDLSPWLGLSRHTADIVAISFQEIVPLNAQNIMLGANLDASSDWEKLIDAFLNGSSEREDGHLVMPNPGIREERQSSASSPTKKSPDTLKLTRLASAEQPSPPQTGTTDPSDVKTPRSTDTCTIASDEGYMSPAEDLASLLSADDNEAPKAYVQVVGKQMVGVYLSVWVRRPILKHVRGVQTTTVATGMMGYLGNKGAVAARMRIFDSGICFIASHLSSGEQEGDELKRNSDYADIIRRAGFIIDEPSAEPDILSQRMTGAEPGEGQSRLGDRSGQWGNSRGIMEISHAIWMGDLNYRLQAPDKEARALVKASDWMTLSSQDQLNIARKENQAFQGWEEGVLSFPPTYKFKRGTNQYVGAKEDDSDGPNTSGPGIERGQKPEEKTRTPAWTDRILWRSQGGLREVSYGSANLLISDHKPVVASFSLVAREYDRSKIQLILETAKTAVQEREAASIPRCELEPNKIEAGVVEYAEAKTLHTVLRNRGRVPASWSFVPISGLASENNGDYELRTSPRWVRIHPEQGELQPGGAVEISMTIWIDGGQENSADYLVSLLKKKLDAIMVLRVEGGNEVFCTIVGTLNPSFFGLSITALQSLPRPVNPSEGWDTGSPQLKINTQKLHKRRQMSDGPPAAFYSPAAVINEPIFDEALAEEKSDKPQTLPGSLDSTAELAHVHAHAESGTDSFFSPRSPGTNTSGLSSVDEMFEAFGVRAEPEVDKTNPVRSMSRSVEPVPPELHALTEFLLADGRMRTESLFIGCLDLVQLWQPMTPHNHAIGEDYRKSKPAVQQIRKSLDRGQGVPSGAHPQEVAAVIICFFLALPDPFLPQEAAASHAWTSSHSVLERLQSFMPPADLAVAQHMVAFLKKLLHKEAAQQNGLTCPHLACLFAEIWFQRSVEAFRTSLLGDRATLIDCSEGLNTAKLVSSLLQS